MSWSACLRCCTCPGAVRAVAGPRQADPGAGRASHARDQPLRVAGRRGGRVRARIIALLSALIAGEREAMLAALRAVLAIGSTSGATSWPASSSASRPSCITRGCCGAPRDERRAEARNDAGFDFPRRLIVAISSSAIDPLEGTGTPQALKEQAAATAQAMLPLLLLDNQLVITHGTGPRWASCCSRGRGARAHHAAVAGHPRRPDAGRHRLPAGTGVRECARAVGSPRHVVGLVTQVEVDRRTGVRCAHQAGRSVLHAGRGAGAGGAVRRDGAGGWPRLRYVVPSPQPRHICDISLVEALMCTRTVVVAGGGGGIPVVRDGSAAAAASRP